MEEVVTETAGRELVPTLVGIWILVCKTRGGARAYLYARPFAGAAHMAPSVHRWDKGRGGTFAGTSQMEAGAGLRRGRKGAARRRKGLRAGCN